MLVISVNRQFFQVGESQKVFSPNADEIYSAVFEDKGSIRGVPVTKQEFLSTGIEFSPFAASPVVVIEVQHHKGGPLIHSRLIAKEGAFETDVSCDDNGLLDYSFVQGRWVPLPIGTIDEVNAMLVNLDLQSLGYLTLSQYLKMIQYPVHGLSVDDRTLSSLIPTQIATELDGTVPSSFHGQLYPYQLAGFRWLSFMVRGGLGCIIADEMGLGKTVQVICLLLELVEGGQTPHLVVAPVTVLENWRRELARFAPTISVLVHSGGHRTGFPRELGRYDVVITSFETAVADISLFRNVQWKIIVLDEAQNIKNPDAKRTIQLKTLSRTGAVAVTGTPIENRLRDLWSITDFAMPALLGPLDEFERRHPDTADGATSLEPVISPLILRRRVADVAKDLPERIDIPQALELDLESVEAYEAIRTAASNANYKGASLAALTQLRLFCTHPWLTGHFQSALSPTECSVKLRRLLEILEEIVETHGKALIFTSYQKSTDILVKEIAAQFHIPTGYIDGRISVYDRQKTIDEFTLHKSAAVLVLNPRAAGTGLNIVAANHVIHYNLEWNPAVEDQASARAYRRGQTKTVTVHRLYFTNTVEEVINDRMQRKRKLAEAAVIGTDGREAEINDLIRALSASPKLKT